MRSRRRRLAARTLTLLATLALLQAGAITVTASATGTEGIDLVLPTGLDVDGLVLDPEGDPIEGAVGGLCAVESFDCFEASGETDAAGHYTALAVVPGTYLVGATADGFLSVWLGAGGTSVTDVSQAVTVEITGDTTLPTLQLDAGFSISGTLSDPEGHGVPGVEVYASGASGGVTVTNGDGLYLLRGLLAGSYSLEVAPPVGSPFTGGTISEGTIVPPDFIPNVEVDGDETGIDATLVVGRSISGTVTGLAGPADVNVSGTVFSRALEIAPDGTFIATGLWPEEPQTLFVGARATETEDSQFPYGVYDGTPNLNADQSAMAEIDVSGGDVTGLTLAAPSLPKVSGTVLDEEDAPVRAFVTLCSDDLGCAGQTLAGDGSYAFINLPDSTYRMFVTAFEHLDGFVTATGGVSTQIQDAADIVVAGANVVLDVVVENGFTISGTITGPNGEPVVDGNVTAAFASGQLFSGAQTDATGAYAIKGLVAGDYIIHVNGPEFGDYFPGFWSLAGYTADYEEADLVHGPSDVSAIVTNPVDGATGVSRTVAPSATYSGELLNVTSSTVKLHVLGSTTAIKATVTYDAVNHVVSLKPKARLHGRTTYVFEVSGVTTSTGGPVPDLAVTFTTRR